MATAKVATAKVAHGDRAIGRRAGDHIRSGNRTMIALLLARDLQSYPSGHARGNHGLSGSIRGWSRAGANRFRLPLKPGCRCPSLHRRVGKGARSTVAWAPKFVPQSEAPARAA